MERDHNAKVTKVIPFKNLTVQVEAYKLAKPRRRASDPEGQRFLNETARRIHT